jgi:hypothetical protein
MAWEGREGKKEIGDVNAHDATDGL